MVSLVLSSYRYMLHVVFLASLWYPVTLYRSVNVAKAMVWHSGTLINYEASCPCDEVGLSEDK